jgi:hypothetical protein
MAIKEKEFQPPSTMPSVEEDRRRFQRIRLQVPMFIRGTDVHGEQFMELAKTLDFSALGAFITCSRQLNLGDFMILTIPAPSITSTALIPAGMPPIQAKVRRQQEAGDLRLIGVEFLKPLV